MQSACAILSSVACPVLQTFYTLSHKLNDFLKKVKNKGKAVPLQAWSGPEGFRKLRFPDFMTTAQDGGKIASLTQWQLLPPRNIPGTHFC